MTDLEILASKLNERMRELYDREADMEGLVKHGDYEQSLKATAELAMMRTALRELHRVMDWIDHTGNVPSA